MEIQNRLPLSTLVNVLKSRKAINMSSPNINSNNNSSTLARLQPPISTQQETHNSYKSKTTSTTATSPSSCTASSSCSQQEQLQKPHCQDHIHHYRHYYHYYNSTSSRRRKYLPQQNVLTLYVITLIAICINSSLPAYVLCHHQQQHHSYDTTTTNNLTTSNSYYDNNSLRSKRDYVSPLYSGSMPTSSRGGGGPLNPSSSGHFSQSQNNVNSNESVDYVDNRKPAFKNCAAYKPSVKEEQPENTYVILVQAEDPDPGQEIKYSLVQSLAERPKFRINPTTGVIVTEHTFDRDEPIHEKAVYVTVQATDNGRPPLDDICTFKVTIEDINDNPPVFNKARYDESMSEDIQVSLNET